MPRDPADIAAPAQEPADLPGRGRWHVPAAQIDAAVRLLLGRERSLDDLAEAVRAIVPGGEVDATALMTRLRARGHIERDGDLLGLTDSGEVYARGLKPLRLQEGERPPTLPDPAPKTEYERRLAVAAEGIQPQDLTRSQRRATSSRADNRTPPMRIGSEDALALPSRVGDVLRYRDGRVVQMGGER